MKKTTKDLYIKIYDRPGSWMADDQLNDLREQLCQLALQTVGDIPDYGVFLKDRSSYRNRLVTVIFDRKENKAVAFSAMVYLTMNLKERKKPLPVIHLGLVMVAPKYQGKKLAYWLYHQPLLKILLRRFLRAFWITSTTMEPVIFGSVADSFTSVYPHYLPERNEVFTPIHLAIARCFFYDHGHEIGIYKKAYFDEKFFVIRESSLGASHSLMFSFADTAK